MKKVKLIPLEGIEIEKIGNIKFGETKESIIAVLGEPSEEQEDSSLYYDNFEIKLDFDEENKLIFIEVFGPFCENIEPVLYKQNPFSLTADQLIKWLTEKNNGQIDGTEAPHCYAFLNISMGIWREVTESEMKNEIRAARDNGEYEQWMEDDLKRAKHFWTIGLGAKDYYSY